MMASVFCEAWDRLSAEGRRDRVSIERLRRVRRAGWLGESERYN